MSSTDPRDPLSVVVARLNASDPFDTDSAMERDESAAHGERLPTDAPRRSLFAEARLLAAILHEPEKRRIAEAIAPPETFSEPALALAYRALLSALDQNDGAFDAETLRNELCAHKAENLVGGVAAFEKFLDDLGSRYDLEAIARRIADYHAARSFGEIMRWGFHASRDWTVPVADAIDDVRRRLGMIALPSRKVPTLADGAIEVFDRITNIAEKTGDTVGISTGFPEYDEATGGGLFPGELIIFGARPRVGKTALALQVAERIARTKGPVLFFSLEMLRRELAARFLAFSSGVLFQRIRTGKALDASDFARMTPNLHMARAAEVRIEDRPSQSVASIASAAQAMKADCGLSLVIVDSLRKVRGSAHYRERRDVVSAVTADLKDLAKTLGVPVLVLAHLSRAHESGMTARKPRMADLAESSGIENDADTVILMHREDLTPTGAKGSDAPKPGEVEFYCAKQRNAEPGKFFKLRFRGEYSRFESIAMERDFPVAAPDAYDDFPRGGDDDC